MGLFSNCGEGLPVHVLPNILIGMHRGTRNLVREIYKSAPGAEGNSNTGRAVPSPTRAHSYQTLARCKEQGRCW